MVVSPLNAMVTTLDERPPSLSDYVFHPSADFQNVELNGVHKQYYLDLARVTNANELGNETPALIREAAAARTVVPPTLSQLRLLRNKLGYKVHRLRYPADEHKTDEELVSTKLPRLEGAPFGAISIANTLAQEPDAKWSSDPKARPAMERLLKSYCEYTDPALQMTVFTSSEAFRNIDAMVDMIQVVDLDNVAAADGILVDVLTSLDILSDQLVELLAINQAVTLTVPQLILHQNIRLPGGSVGVPPSAVQKQMATMTNPQARAQAAAANSLSADLRSTTSPAGLDVASPRETAKPKGKVRRRKGAGKPTPKTGALRAKKGSGAGTLIPKAKPTSVSGSPGGPTGAGASTGRQAGGTTPPGGSATGTTGTATGRGGRPQETPSGRPGADTSSSGKRKKGPGSSSTRDAGSGAQKPRGK